MSLCEAKKVCQAVGWVDGWMVERMAAKLNEAFPEFQWRHTYIDHAYELRVDARAS